jgi:hypothetical protein
MTTFSPSRHNVPSIVVAHEHPSCQISSVNPDDLPVGEIRPELLVAACITKTSAGRIRVGFVKGTRKTLVYAQCQLCKIEDAQSFLGVPLPPNWFVQGIHMARGLRLGGKQEHPDFFTIGFVMDSNYDTKDFLNALLLHRPTRAIDLVFDGTTYSLDATPFVPGLEVISGSGELHLMDAHGIVREVIRSTMPKSYIFREAVVNNGTVARAYAAIYEQPEVRMTLCFADVPKDLLVWSSVLQEMLPDFQDAFRIDLGGVIVPVSHKIGVSIQQEDHGDVFSVPITEEFLLESGTREGKNAWFFSASETLLTDKKALQAGVYKLLSRFVSNKQCAFCNNPGLYSCFPLCHPFDTSSVSCKSCFETIVYPQRVKVHKMRRELPLTPEYSDGESVTESATKCAIDSLSDLFPDPDDEESSFRAPPPKKRVRRPTDPVEEIRWRIQRNKFARLEGQGGIRRGALYEAQVAERVEDERQKALQKGVDADTFEELVREWKAL